MKLNLISGRDMCKIIEKIGFKKIHQVGSHVRYIVTIRISGVNFGVLYSPKSSSPLLRVCKVDKEQAHRPYCHWKQGCVGLEEKVRKIHKPGASRQHETKEITGTIDSARKEKGPACQHPDSPVHESVSTVDPKAVGQAQKPHDAGHIASCTHGKARKRHARTQGALCSPCRAV